MSMCSVCITHYHSGHYKCIIIFCHLSGVTYVMMKSTTPKQDIWLSLLITLKNKPFHILQTLHRKVGLIVLFCMLCFGQLTVQVL